jgi:arginyl-tRNA synthetase
VRCAGILRQVTERGYPDTWGDDADLTLLGQAEIEFIHKMLELPDLLVFAHDNLVPHQIAFWTLELAQIFHPLYENSRVLHSEVPEDIAKARLQLFKAAKIVFKRALNLMGMTAPDRM